MKIYILEDSPVMAERITERLSTMPFVEINGISDSEENAFAEITRLRPDFLIIDIILKEVNGVNLLTKIKTELPEIKVSMFDYSTGENFVKYMLLGTGFHFDRKKEFKKTVSGINIARDII